jgi:hypothetical protein
MKSSIGVWIDKTKAMIISPERIIETIPSEIDIRPRIEGQGKEYGRLGSQFLSLEKSKQNRLQQQEIKFLKKVCKEIKAYEQILIYGPAQMKNKLEQYIIEDHSMKDKFVEVRKTEKMTENQLVAFVREFFEGLEVV